MKALRLFIFFLLAVVVVFIALSALMPTSQKITRSVTVNAPATLIYEQLKTLNNFNRIAAWGNNDSTLVYTFTGTDGTIGASASWKGSPEISGEGKIEITALQPAQKVEHKIHFITPRKGSAVSTFSLSGKEKTTTEVNWVFEMATPRPWNIFNLFYNLDEKMGKDFETGLTTLKKLIEIQNTDTPQNP